MTLSEIAYRLGCPPDKQFDNVEIRHVARLDEATAGDIAFLHNMQYAPQAANTAASAIIVAEDFAGPLPAGCRVLRVPNPHEASRQVIELLYPKPSYVAGVHPTAVIGKGTKVHPTASVGAYVVIGDNSSVEEGCVIEPGTILGSNVSIGKDSHLYPRVVCYDGVNIGARCILHSGCVIGSDGFGYVPTEDRRWKKIEHIGSVTLGDDVEIGANATVDRGSVGRTVLESGTKIDNLVHIAHNVRVGENSAFAAQVGIAGSAKIGRRVRLGGQVGIAGHLSIADDTTVMAQSGVAKSIQNTGNYLGSPALPLTEEARRHTASRRVPELLREVQALQKELQRLHLSISAAQSTTETD